MISICGRVAIQQHHQHADFYMTQSLVEMRLHVDNWNWFYNVREYCWWLEFYVDYVDVAVFLE